MIYDDLDNHLPQAGSIERAAVPLGMYLAWCANLGLLSAAFQRAHEQLVLRLRYREITGSELLVAGCGGCLTGDVLSESGNAFTQGYFDRYLADFRDVFGADIYGVTDDWAHYDLLAPVITEHYLGNGRAGARRNRWQDRRDSQAAKGNTERRERTESPQNTEGRRWWHIWR